MGRHAYRRENKSERLAVVENFLLIIAWDRIMFSKFLLLTLPNVSLNFTQDLNSVLFFQNRPLNKPQRFKKTEVIACIFSDHKATKPELKHKTKSGKTTNTWKLNSMLQNQ